MDFVEDGVGGEYGRECENVCEEDVSFVEDCLELDEEDEIDPFHETSCFGQLEMKIVDYFFTLP